ncbi:MAG: ABC transporter permease [bacterium]
MRDYLLKRLLLTVPVVFGVLVLVFVLMHLVPGDPVEVMLGEAAGKANREALRAELHLDEPLYVQFYYFLRDLATGRIESLYYGRPVMEEVGKRLFATIELAVAAMVVSILVSVPLGIVAAIRKGKGVDAAAMGFSMAGVSMPSFWLGPMLILLFSIKLELLPVSGRGSFAHLILPAITLGTGMAAIVSRMIRGSLLDVLGEDYLRTARAKGLPEKVVIFKHALRNALIPSISVVGLQAGALLAGAIITETIFAWPGIGSMLIQAIHARDFPLVQGTVIVIALSYVLVNLVTDIAYAVADPRVRLKKEKAGG